MRTFILLVVICLSDANDQERLSPRSMIVSHPDIVQPSSLQSNDTIYGSYKEEIFCVSEGDFFCADESRCINAVYECDNYTDCSDGSDEHESCAYFHCQDEANLALNLKFVCDGFDDCPNGFDEDESHGHCEVVRCGSDGARKKARGSDICNGVSDCKDFFNSDECNCSFSFICSNYKCIHDSKTCDGNDDCGDNSDEMQCREFMCENGNRLFQTQVCDGVDQCGDSSDECACANSVQCRDSKCILQHQRCDGVNDCGDWSDECFCLDSFICANGKCISNEYVGNGYDECGDGSDEHVTMKIFAPTVKTNTTTAAPSDRSTGTYQMTSHMQPNCTESNTISCASGQCISAEMLCDRKEDCIDGSDESDCFSCKDGMLVPSSAVCNDFNDCYDGTDECGCGLEEATACPKTTTKATTTEGSRTVSSTATSHAAANTTGELSDKSTTVDNDDRRSVASCWKLSRIAAALCFFVIAVFV